MLSTACNFPITPASGCIDRQLNWDHPGFGPFAVGCSALEDPDHCATSPLPEGAISLSDIFAVGVAGDILYACGQRIGGQAMRVIVFVAAFLGGLCGPGSAYDLQTKRGQAICDTLLEFEELSLAIGMEDNRHIEEMGTKGCHFPEAGLRMTLIEAYRDQTVLLFRKLADYTRLGPVPERIDRLTNLAKIRLFYRDRDSRVGFTLLRVTGRPDGQGDLNDEN
jgi:hypothetical protein